MLQIFHWEQVYNKWKKKKTSSSCILLEKIFNYKNQLRDARQRMFGIVNLFHQWRHFLEGTSHHRIVYLDCKNLKYYILACVLNRCQACWNMSSSRFDFIITYWPKKQKKLSDALSWRSYITLKVGALEYDQL